MEEMSGKVQNANTHILRRQNHEHAHSNRSVQGSVQAVQGGDGRNVLERSKASAQKLLRFCTRLSRSASLRLQCRRRCHHPARKNGGAFVPAGRWMKVQGYFKLRAHPGSQIGVHVGVDQRCRAHDGESPAILPTMSKRNVPAGRWNVTHGFDSRESSPPATQHTKHQSAHQRGDG